jgi:hypothetical protein
MSMRIISEEDAQERLTESVRKIKRVKRMRASKHEIKLAEAEKAVWNRVLYHIKNGEMITLDDEDRIELHVDVPTA